MRVPLGWLAELVTWTEPVGTLVERLTMTGLKVEGLETVGDLDVRLVAGRLVAVEPHPRADRLYVCRVEVGAAEAVTIVSGAPGLDAGQHVAVALPGATLPGGRVVGAVELRGVHSAGVLCSEAECGLGSDRDRVLELSPEHVAGTPLRDLPGVQDVVVEFEITANRGDCLSLLGIAREVAAVTGARLREPRTRLREQGPPAGDAVHVTVEAPDLCLRYAARVVRGVRVGRSPFPVRLRLERAGMRAVNDVVDATNYVMLEQGQPLHAFDLARIAEGRIVVRRARAGERLVTLDGVERLLDPDDLVIADARGPIALAGVMGGQESEVTAATSALLLESAFFAPQAVRRTSRRLGLPSQASYRFERRVDPARVPLALDAVADAIARRAGGQIAPGIVEDAPGLDGHAPPPVLLRPERALDMLGMQLPRGEVARRLRAIGATIVVEGRALRVEPPTWRADLVLEEDLAEEIARLGGYDALPSSLPLVPATGGAENPPRLAMRRLRRLLAAEGLSEMVTLAFADAGTNHVLPGFVGAGLAPVAVANPLSSELGEMRRTPLVGLVRAARSNIAQGISFVGAFELGKGYGTGPAGERREPRAITVLLWGEWPPCGLERTGAALDFFDLKGVLANVLAGMGLGTDMVRWRPAPDVRFLHPGKASRIEAAGRTLGVAGALHPKVAQVCDLPGEVWVAELDFDGVAFYGPARVVARPIPRFPVVTRDIAVVVDESFEAEAILEEIRALHDPLIESARVFDCYRGAPIPAGRKSLAYGIAYRAPDRTLTDDEVNGLHARVRERLRERFRIELRS